MKKIYEFVVKPIESSVNKTLISPVIDFGEGLRHGVFVGYYDAKGRYHDLKNRMRDMARENDLKKILKNAAIISIATPIPILGTGMGIATIYVAYRGAAILLEKRNDRRRESRLAEMAESRQDL